MNALEQHITTHQGRYLSGPLGGRALETVLREIHEAPVTRSGRQIYALWQETDTKHAERSWKREICAILRADGHLVLHTRTTCYVPRPALIPPWNDIPAPVKRILAFGTYTDAGLPLLSAAHTLSSNADVDTLIHAICDPERALPIIVISEPLQVDPAACGQRLYGVAHVAHLSREASYTLSDKLERRWSAWDGAIRTFTRPFDNLHHTVKDHPIILGKNIAKDGDDFLAILVRRAYRAGVAGLREETFAIDSVSGLELAAHRIAACPINDLHALDTRLTQALESIADLRDQYYHALSQGSRCAEDTSLDTTA